MDKYHSKRSDINNELAARAANKRARKVIKNHTPSNELVDLKIDFYCECSNPTCSVRLPLTLDEFEEVHQKHSHFIIAAGHATPAVEKVVRTMGNIQIVDKYIL